MTVVLLVIFAILAINTTTFEQSTVDTQERVRRPQSPQQVLLRSECRKGNDIRLKLLNETDWAISVQTFSMYLDPLKRKRYTLFNSSTVFLLPNDKEISSLFYWVDAEKRIKGETLTKTTAIAADNSSTSWIGPKDSIFFDVPEKYLSGNNRLYIRFNYEWEQPASGLTVIFSPEHRIYHPGLVNEGDKIMSCL
jgi:hypothetical protein